MEILSSYLLLYHGFFYIYQHCWPSQEMKHKDNKSIGQVIKHLRMYGLDAKAMLERKKKSCDVIARYRNNIYYIEIKDKLGPKRPGNYILKYGYNSTANKIIENAVEQLRSMPDIEKCFRIIWFIVPEDDDEEFILGNIISTLYGIQRVGLQRGDLNIEMDCFYFLNNPFMKFIDLDCVIIQTVSGLVFCPNNFSQNYSRLRKSKFYAMHKRKDGVIDPAILEKENCCIVASPNKPKSEMMMQEILRKYKFHKIWVIEKEKHLGLSETFTVKMPKGQQRHAR